jgi:uncharacterized integral membrane protein
MEFEKVDILLSGIIIFVVIAVIFMSNVTGGIVADTGSLNNPLTGLIILLVFVVAGYLVSKTMLPESKFRVE